MKGVGFKFDKSNSYYNYVKSFPNNSEIDVSIHYKSISPKYKFTLADSRSMIHKYHISISLLPASSYVPRVADDRVGHFMTMYQDYSDTYKESPYVRFINRWNLQKLNPSLNISEPIEPIVFWIENTVPHEFRDAVREGIEKWNLAFEKIGFKNAIVAKQMPDDATWDPADTRYNTIRWMVQPGSAYAVGPSRANPFTGELYDADINPIYVPAGRSGEVYAFGQKTLLQDQSALDRINVRRLLIDIRRKVKKIGEQLLFEPNRASTLKKFEELVEPIMANVQKRRGVVRYKVQIDSTTIYGLKNFNGDLKKHHLRDTSLYNTYMHKGLPPGPISNPSFNSLIAAGQPSSHDFFYFVAKGECSHVFSTNYEDHLRAVQKYQLRK